MLNENLVKLQARKLAGEASAEELHELSVHLQNHPEDQYFFELLQNFWDQPKHKETVSTSEEDFLNAHFEYIMHQAEFESDEAPDELNNTVEKQEEINESKPKSVIISLVRWVSIAAAITALFFGAKQLVKLNSIDGLLSQKNEVLAKPGAKSKMVLPDGTIVWLNSGSKLTYAGSFKDSVRSVELDGEAFFDVTKDAKHPFIVHTSGIDIRVLGTAFNVKSYSTEATIEATLIRGLIEVVKKNESQSPKIILRPHEKLVFNKEEQTIVKSSSIINADNIIAKKVELAPKEISITPLPKNRPDTALVETSWVYNKLIFEGDTFSEIAIKMERWFNVHISFKDKKVSEYRFRGVFENENVEQALKALQLTASFKYKINGNEIEILKK